MSKNEQNAEQLTPYFAITNQQTGAVLLEITSFGKEFAASTLDEMVVEEECRGLFKDALAFIAEAQARSYELFGRIVTKDAETVPSLRGSTAAQGRPRSRGNKLLDIVGPEDGQSISVIDSAEWEGEDDSRGFGGDDKGGGCGTASAEGDSVASGVDTLCPPPKKKKT
ncbi:hypothetical protein ERJ75_001232700 [Trypanosoma vivax]|nr:hypothetical protein TRVL_00744 [Trypanosoma vivax]KAH8609012.1 hypothetical protein ERJ75_001232700 [Trypanosoma vivax]